MDGWAAFCPPIHYALGNFLMTLLICWVGIDNHGTSSLYMAADSRVSWKVPAPAHFDFARKVFAFAKWPDVLGYSGDVLFPTMALSQIVDIADAGLLFSEDFSPKQKFQAIVDKLNDLFRQYPTLCSGLSENSLSVIHGSRDPKNNKRFFSHTIRWNKKRGWHGEERHMPSESGVLFSLGTGADDFSENLKRYEAGPTKGTSRYVFHCFCDTIANTTDPTVGGAPQLVGIIRKPETPAITFGIINQGRRTFLGAHIDNLRNFGIIEWRNSNFERCDGMTMQRFPTAQSQPDTIRRLLQRATP